MRLLTWNINGIKTLPKYHPWNTLPDFDAILQHLNADIICFQELKTTRKLLTPPLATPPSFTAHISLPLSKPSYSGVGIYTRSSAVIPLKAEEGLTGLLQPRPPLTEEERVSGLEHYPPHLLSPSEEGEEPNYADLDSEGRTLTLDFGLFVLINTYCPASSESPSRLAYKNAYHALLSARLKGLIEIEHREVILVGDLNACASVLDHCEGALEVEKGRKAGMEGEEGFWGAERTEGMEGKEGKEGMDGKEDTEGKKGVDGKEGRRWLRDLVKEGGPMVDIVRRFWPRREGMYTCWNTKLNARETNYGARIDFVLATPGLMRWIKAGDTQPSVRGSDHCPVYVDFYDEIRGDDGEVVRLRDALGMGGVEGGEGAGAGTGQGMGTGEGTGQGMGTGEGTGTGEGQEGHKTRPPPRICTKFWDEFSGRQTSLAQFFGSRGGASSVGSIGSGTLTAGSSSSLTPGSSSSSSSSSTPTPTPAPIPPTESNVGATPTTGPPPTTNLNPPATSTKRKLVPEPSTSTKKVKKGEKRGQQSIASFFSKPSASSSSSSSSSPSKVKRPPSSQPPTTNSSNASPVGMDTDADYDQEDEDYKLALQLSQEHALPSSQSSQTSSTPSQGIPGTANTSNSTASTNVNGKTAKSAWTSLLAPLQPPSCRAHNEPAREYTVNKAGPNKGKKFFICSRPVGPGYDMGKSERLREHVDLRYRCDFFKWSSDVRREQQVLGKGG